MKITNKKRFISFITIVMILIVSIFNCVSAIKTVEYQDYTVARGDTLWSIACENTETDIREYIYELREINNLNDCMIYPGQTIKIIK